MSRLSGFRTAIVVAACGAALLVPMVAEAVTTPSYPISVSRALATTLTKVARATPVPIRIPTTLKSTVKYRHIYATGAGFRRSYDLQLSTLKDCQGDASCFLADFKGVKGAKISGRKLVRLTNSITGRFTPTSCVDGACAAPRIQWIQGGVAYTVQTYGAAPKAEQSTAIYYANQAIRSKPR